MTVFPSRKVAAPCWQYLKDGDGERVSEMSVGRQNDALVVAEQVGAGDVMQLSIHPEQQVAVIVCTQTHTHTRQLGCCGCQSVSAFILFTITFKIAGLVHQSLVGAAPAYLADDYRLLSDVGRRPLRSNSNDMRNLLVP